MATVRATLDNSSECWTDYLKRCVGINDMRMRRHLGTYKLYTWDEVVKHDKVHDCWLVIHGKVYDVTEWVPHHPGGKLIYDGAGGDCGGGGGSSHRLSSSIVLNPITSVIILLFVSGCIPPVV